MSYAPVPSTNQVKRGLARFIQQFKNKKNLNGLAQAYLNRIQELENAAWEVINYRSLTTSSGAQVDALGAIVGAGRGNLDDADYLVSISAEILVNRSSGTVRELLAISLLILVPPHFTLLPAYPATLVLRTFQTAVANVTLQTLFQSLCRAKDAGVRLIILSTPLDPPTCFTFGPYSAPDQSPIGFSDYLAAPSGGFLINAIDG